MSSKKVKISEASTSFCEEEYGKRIDRCLTDAVVKGSGGLLLGAALSLLLFRKRSWPVIMGTGFGTGMAFKNCEKELNSINTPPKIEFKEFFHEARTFLVNEQKHFNVQDNAETINRCFNDLLIKGAGGIIVGSVLSFVFSSPWPVFLGISFGAGAAYRNCVHELENTKKNFKGAEEENIVEENIEENREEKTAEENTAEENTVEENAVEKNTDEENTVEEKETAENVGEQDQNEDTIEKENKAGENKNEENLEDKNENYDDDEPEFFPPPNFSPTFPEDVPHPNCPPCPPCPPR